MLHTCACAAGLPITLTVIAHMRMEPMAWKRKVWKPWTFATASLKPLVNVFTVPCTTVYIGPQQYRRSVDHAFVSKQLGFQDVCSVYAGEQERPTENLEKIHADAIRKEVEALKADPAGLPMKGAEAAMRLESHMADDEGPVIGPVLPDIEEAEDDPYNLPITHEVALEGTEKRNLANFFFILAVATVR